MGLVGPPSPRPACGWPRGGAGDGGARDRIDRETAASRGSSCRSTSRSTHRDASTSPTASCTRCSASIRRPARSRSSRGRASPDRPETAASAVDAQINEPTGLALGDGRVRSTSPTSPRTACAGSIRTGRSRPSPNLSGPAEVALDPTGRWLAVPLLGHVVFRIDLRSGKSKRIAGDGNAETTGDGGPARRAQVESPHGAAYDADGNLSSRTGAYIRRIDAGRRRDHDGRGRRRRRETRTWRADGGPSVKPHRADRGLTGGTDRASAIRRRHDSRGRGNGFIGDNGEEGRRSRRRSCRAASRSRRTGR